MGQEFQKGSAGQLTLGVSHAIFRHIAARGAVIQRLNWAGKSNGFLTWLEVHAGCQLGAQVVLLTGVSICSLSRQTSKVADFPQSIPRDKMEAENDLTSHAVSHPTTSYWLQVSQEPREIQVWGIRLYFLIGSHYGRASGMEALVQPYLENSLL